jgi:hypothetical protein
MVLSCAYDASRTQGDRLVSNDREGRKNEVNWLKHAFAVDPPGPIEPNEMQRALVEKVCSELVRRRLTSPALFTLEMSRPLNYVSAQFLHFLQPFVTLIADKSEYQNLTLFLEQRGSIDYVCRRLEALEVERGAKPVTEATGLQSPGPHAQD